MDSLLGKNAKVALLFFLVALACGLIPWGLGLIGVTVNIWLGGAILALAFGIGAVAFWIWGGSCRFHVALRWAALLVAGGIYFGLVGKQVLSQYKRDHPLMAITFPRLSYPLPQLMTDPNQKPEDYKQPPKPSIASTRKKTVAHAVPTLISSNVNQEVLMQQAPSVISAPNGIAIGGGTVTNPTVNNYGPLEAEFTMQVVSSNVPDGVLYRSDYRLDVTTRIPVPAVRLTVYAKTIHSFEVIPQRSGGEIGGWTGRRDGSSFTTLQNVYGHYIVKVTTTEAEKLRFEYDPKPL